MYICMYIYIYIYICFVGLCTISVLHTSHYFGGKSLILDQLVKNVLGTV